MSLPTDAAAAMLPPCTPVARKSFSTVDAEAPPGETCRYQVIAFTLDEYTSPPAESEDFIRSFPGSMP